MRVLLADSDPDFLDVTSYALHRAGFNVLTATTAEEALTVWRDKEPDLVMLDVSMPHMGGLEVCRAIRATSMTPIMLFGSQRKESEIIRGFEVGADDYLVKPFSIQHLVMRLRAVQRRAASHTMDVIPARLVVGPLTIDADAFSVLLEGRSVSLTRLELRLLYCLAANENRVVSTGRLIDFVWGMDGEADGSLLKTHVSHIRSKLRRVSDWPIEIRAYPGVGYSLKVGAQANSENLTAT